MDELVGRVGCKGDVVDSTLEKLTELKAPPGSGRVEKPSTDALADVPQGTLGQDATSNGSRAEQARFVLRPGPDVVEGRSDVLAKPAARNCTRALG